MNEIIYELKKLIDSGMEVDLYFADQCFMQVYIDDVTDEYVKFHCVEIDFDQKEKNLEDKVTSKLIRYFYLLVDLKGISYCLSSVPTDFGFDEQEFLQ